MQHIIELGHGADDQSGRTFTDSLQQFVEIGEVKRPDTLNYRTFKPEKDGLFCERIFGPVNDWTCSCGQIKEQRFALDHERALLGKFKPKVCPNCQVEVTSSRLRRYRMGYISLACPVTHIWYLNSRPSLFSILLKMPTKYIKKIAYYKAYSPSSKQREYMSSCLGPGGDFFDNEWEFLHFWLSGKHSIDDIPSRTTKASRTKAQKFEDGKFFTQPLPD
jgi:DNA-directed RNA polymerase beta' subunit